METKKFWGVLIGAIIGYVLAKIYLICSLLSEMTSHRIAGYISIDGTPFYSIALNNSTVYTLMIIVILSTLGYKFVVTTYTKKHEVKETPLQQ